MNPNDFPRVWPDMIPALEAALLRYEEGVAALADFKKKYASVKRKVKRIEKYLITMDEDEDTRKFSELCILNNVRLAENKFILINKKLKRFKQSRQHYSKKSLRALKGPNAFDRNMTRWHIQHVSAHLENVNGLLREVNDMLRIAKGHLKKVDDHKKSIARIKKRRRLL